jgi:hypothetical protein
MWESGGRRKTTESRTSSRLGVARRVSPLCCGRLLFSTGVRNPQLDLCSLGCLRLDGQRAAQILCAPAHTH